MQQKPIVNRQDLSATSRGKSLRIRQQNRDILSPAKNPILLRLSSKVWGSEIWKETSQTCINYQLTK